VISWQYALLGIGVLVCLIAAYMMGWGEPILGENHTGYATVILIVGLGIITSSSVSFTNSASKS
jgi:hypothetical protein